MNKKAQLEYFDREITRMHQEIRLLRSMVGMLAKDTELEEIFKKLKYVI